jgi:outer membrane protein TolC
MVAAGESDKLSVLKTELQIAQNETDLLQARIESSNSRQALRDLIALRIDENTTIYPDPNELKRIPPIPDLSVANAINRAKELRPDYLNSVIGRKKAELDLQTRLSSILPKLDLSFAYGYTGSGNTFTSAKDDLLLFGPPTASVGLELTYSFFNDSARFEWRQAKFALHRTEVQVEEALNSLTKEVTAATVSVDMGQRRLKTAEMSRVLSERKLQAEFEKFRVGESRIRDIIDSQNEVNNARITEINARVDFMKSLTALRTAIGELPDGVTVSYPQ